MTHAIKEAGRTENPAKSENTLRPQTTISVETKQDNDVVLLDGSRNTLIHTPSAEYATITPKQIVAFCKAPSAKPKANAPAIIPSTYRAHNAREHAAQREHGRYPWSCFDIDTGNKTLAEVKAAFQDVFGDETSMLIYSTSGSTADNRKWRVLIPLTQPTLGSDYTEQQEALCDLLGEQGVICDRALCRTGQPVFLPNVPPDKRDTDGVPLFYQHEIHKGSLFNTASEPLQARLQVRADAEAAWAKHAEIERQKAAQRRAERVQEYGDGTSPVDAFNAANALPDLMLQYGYVHSHKDHWISPNSESKGASVRVYGDRWVSLTTSDAEIGRGFASGTSGDAFDLYVHYEHVGRYEDAVRAYAREAGLNGQRDVSLDDFDEVPVPQVEVDAKAQSLGEQIENNITGITAKIFGVENAPTAKIDIARIAKIIGTSFLSPSQGKVYFMNRDGDLVSFPEAKGWKYLEQTFGDPVDITDILNAMPKLHKGDAEAYTKALRGVGRSVVMDHICLYRQRGSISWRVDPFTQTASFTLREFDALVTIPHRPYPTGPIKQEYIDDIHDHWRELDEFLEFIVAARFAIDRKQAYLWWQADTDFGKGLICGLLKELGIVAETSVKEIEAVMEGKPVGLSADNFKRAIILYVDEFKNIKSEIKQLQNTIELSPKNQLRQSVDIYTKLFTSAESVASLVTTHGVEDQFANRMSMFRSFGNILWRNLFKNNQVEYAASLKNWMAQKLNEHFQTYVKMGREKAAKKATDAVREFHRRYGIGLMHGRASEAVQMIADEFVQHVKDDTFNDDLVPSIHGLILKSPRKHLMAYLDRTMDFSEIGVFKKKANDILEAACVTRDGVKTYKVGNTTLKGVVISSL